MSTTIRCRLATKKVPLDGASDPVHEELAPMAERTLIEVQAMMRKHNVGVATFDRKSPTLFCGIGGGVVECDKYMALTNMQITHVFGEPVSANNLDELAYRIGAPFVNIEDARKLTYQIANGSGSQLASISQLAAVTAPAMLVLGDDASTSCLDITSNSFSTEKQARQYIQHLDLWMNSILEEQGIEDGPELIEPWLNRIAHHLSVDFKSARKQLSLG